MNRIPLNDPASVWGQAARRGMGQRHGAVWGSGTARRPCPTHLQTGCLRIASVRCLRERHGAATVPYTSRRRVAWMDRDPIEAAIDYLRTEDPELRRRKKHRLPIHSYAQSDHEFFFTLCARHLESPCSNSELARAIVDALLWRKSHHDWMLFRYCLMPDHLHFVVRLPPGEVRFVNAGKRGVVPYGILDQVGEFKSFTSSQIWWKHFDGEGSLWQASSYDRVIRHNDSIEPAIQYVLNNPVRKGLVTDWRSYPFAARIDGV